MTCSAQIIGEMLHIMVKSNFLNLVITDILSTHVPYRHLYIGTQTLHFSDAYSVNTHKPYSEFSVAPNLFSVIEPQILET